MAGRRRARPSGQQGALPVEDYRHAGATRPNNPPAAIAAEPPLLPLLNRTQEIGSTAGVEFRTKRPVFATMASDIGHVVADTAAWEQSAAFRLEQAAQQGLIRFYAQNEGMDLSPKNSSRGAGRGSGAGGGSPDGCGRAG